MLLSTQRAVLLAGWLAGRLVVCVLNRSAYAYSTVYLSCMLTDRQMPLAKYPPVNIHTPGPLQMLRVVVRARFKILRFWLRFHVLQKPVDMTQRFAWTFCLHLHGTAEDSIFPTKCWCHLQIRILNRGLRQHNSVGCLYSYYQASNQTVKSRTPKRCHNTASLISLFSLL